MKLIRVGDTVYGSGRKVVARFMHGSWYKLTAGAEPEYEPCNPIEAMDYIALPDVSEAEPTKGEKTIISTAKRIIGTYTGKWKDKHAGVIRMVEEGVLQGLHKYGPFEPGKDERNLIGKAREKARNIVVYGSMYCSDPGARHRQEMEAIVAGAAALIARMDGLD